MHFVDEDDLRGWYGAATRLSDLTQGIGGRSMSPDYMEDALGLPFHLHFAIEHLLQADPTAGPDTLSSIPFYSLCRGLLLPLAGLDPARVVQVFGFAGEAPPRAAAREELLETFLAKDVGLNLTQKLACLLGDPFCGGAGTIKRESLMRLLESVEMVPRRALLDRLTRVGDVAVLFAESRPNLREEPALTAAEVLEALRFIPKVGRTRKFHVLRALLARCGKLEAYFLAKLCLRKAGFGFDYQGALVAKALAEHYNAPAAAVQHAMALTDPVEVARILTEEGADGLRAIQLQPLVPVRPALATGSTDEIKAFPVGVERKYDGIRLMLHKSTGQRGSVLCGAYTRGRRDWLELVQGLDACIKMIPARSAILDGELYGTVLTIHGPRPATVYEVYAYLQGERAKPVQLKYAAFDLVYLNGYDLTQNPLAQRRQQLQGVLGQMSNMPLPVAFSVADGQLASDKDDVNRLYHHFRQQGYEGIITKDLEGQYKLAERDASWRKRKPLITLDLVLLGAVFAVTEKKKAGMFGSYVIGARTGEGTFVDVGDVAGVDVERDRQIQATMMRDGLITGRRIERQSVSGVRPGLELVPSIVVTLKFEGIAKDLATHEPRLRDPKILHLRSDKTAREANTLADIEAIGLRDRMG